MRLLIDLGNNRLKWAVSDGDQWRSDAATVSGTHLETFLDEIWRGLPAPDQVVAGSVAQPQRAEQISQWCQTHWQVVPRWVSACSQQKGVTNCYTKPETLGVDRWAALIAARDQAGQTPAVVVDCGTAVTVDALAANGRFIGGVILPGLHMARHALTEGASNLHMSQGDASRLPACRTEDAVAAGTLHGLAGAIAHILTLYRQQLGAEPLGLITGGDASQIAPLLAHELIIEPDLVLKGLALMADDLC